MGMISTMVGTKRRRPSPAVPCHLAARASPVHLAGRAARQPHPHPTSQADPEGEFLDGTFGTPSGDIDVEMGRPAAGGGPTPDAGFAGSSAVNSAMGTMGMAAAQGAFESTKGTFATYATTDRLQPFFNVPAQTVVTRLASSLHPLKAASIVGEETPDLYGPLMVVLTMAAILLNELKQDASVVAQDGTLIGGWGAKSPSGRSGTRLTGVGLPQVRRWGAA